MVDSFQFARTLGRAAEGLEARSQSDNSSPEWNSRGLLRVIEASLDPLIVSDAEGQIQLASQSTLAVFGWEPKEIVGQNLRVLMPEPIRSKHDGYLARYQEDGIAHVIGTPREVQARRRDGQIFPCEICVNTVDVPEDPRLFFVAVLRDISRRRYHEDRWRALIAAAPGDIATVDSKLGMKIHSSQPLLSFRQGPSEDPFEMREPEKVRLWIQRALETGEHGSLEYEAAGPSTKRRISCQIQPFALNERENEAVLTFTDVTELHSAKRSIELMRGVAAIGRSVALAVHRINNPLASIKNATLLLRKTVPGDHSNSRFLDLIAAETDRAAMRARHMMDVHSPEFANVEEASLLESIEDVVALVRVDAFAAGVEIICIPVPSTIVLNIPHSLLREIVFQLLRNAIAASPRGNRVQVEVFLGSRRLRVAIRDAGRGIRPDIAGRASGPVFSDENGDHLGLGLAICHDLAQTVGWTVRHQLLEPAGTSAELVVPIGSGSRGEPSKSPF